MEEHDDLLDPSFKEKPNASNNTGEELPNATTTLVLGILSIVGCFLYAIPGIVLGIIGLSIHGKDKRMYEAEPERYEQSFKNAKAGYICSIIGLSMSALYFLILVWAIFVVASGPGFGRVF
jgi:hypothetical protein